MSAAGGVAGGRLASKSHCDDNRLSLIHTCFCSFLALLPWTAVTSEKFNIPAMRYPFIAFAKTVSIQVLPVQPIVILILIQNFPTDIVVCAHVLDSTSSAGLGHLLLEGEPFIDIINFTCIKALTYYREALNTSSYDTALTHT